MEIDCANHCADLANYYFSNQCKGWVVYALQLQRVPGFYIGITPFFHRRFNQHVEKQNGAYITGLYGIRRISHLEEADCEKVAMWREWLLVRLYASRNFHVWGADRRTVDKGTCPNPTQFFQGDLEALEEELAYATKYNRHITPELVQEAHSIVFRDNGTYHSRIGWPRLRLSRDYPWLNLIRKLAKAKAA